MISILLELALFLGLKNLVKTFFYIGKVEIVPWIFTFSYYILNFQIQIEGISTEWVFLIYALQRSKVEIFVNKKK